jgi:hypothetical protein
VKVKDQWFKFPRQLLTSPALRVLNIHERHALDCIMEEHQRKSGYVNDGLIVTWRDFKAWGIHPRHITPSQRVLMALNIVKCTRNFGGSRAGRTPNMWRPTFLPRTPDSNERPTHDYLEIETLAEAKRIAAMHRIHETRTDRPPPKRQTKEHPTDDRNRNYVPNDTSALLHPKADQPRCIDEPSGWGSLSGLPATGEDRGDATTGDRGGFDRRRGTLNGGGNPGRAYSKQQAGIIDGSAPILVTRLSS